ncbi:three-helix bundle dimerization domain-containing protein [Nocardia thailandica]|uniref:three-helix bundle dimerization domain-containing protein n=1 Tax=Nocardia thailandica TaxID=257275 RepID=UPI0003111237|nr:hypothetical protein [Nocardia thailandica]
MPTDEDKHIAEVITRLGQRYPGIDATVIDAIVHDAWEHFDSAPVREFVPLLVERNAVRAIAATAT